MKIYTDDNILLLYLLIFNRNITFFNKVFLFAIKLINKEVVEFINKYAIENKKGLKLDEYEKKINDIYNNPDFNGKIIYEGFKKEYVEIDKFNLDKIPAKVKYVYKDIKYLEKDYKLNRDENEYEEEEKIKEIKDLDELAKYIQGEPKKKKKKKKNYFLNLFASVVIILLF